MDSLAKGYDFSGTFDLLHNQHKLNRDKSFSIALRVHRGGGFTKDRLYLSGLRNIYNYAKQGHDLNILLTGKMAIEYKAVVQKMQSLGLANTSKYYTDAYETNQNSNTNLDFILKSLK